MYTVKDHSPNLEDAILVAVFDNSCSEIELNEQISELAFLAETAGAQIIQKVIQKRSKIDPATFIGKGKVTTLLNQAEELNCKLIIFNNELGPTQLKNLQKSAGEKIKILDRTGLILDIFNKHAKTKEAKTQVKLAQLQYLLPRLTRQWTHLERQMGGIGTRGGPGETQIEIDRRLIRNQITKLKNDLTKIQAQQVTQNLSRNNAFKIALIGYTNAGKSTLMKAMTEAEVYIQDQLFATLDTTTRKLDNIKGAKVIISDTVGFIRNLPHDLIASFRSTLSVVNDADLLIKVVDASSAFAKEHIKTINKVLKMLNIENKTELLVLNKIDLVKDSKDILGLKKNFKNSIFLSAERKLKLEDLFTKITEIVENLFSETTLLIPHNKGSLIKKIYDETKVLQRHDEYDGVKLRISAPKNYIDVLKQELKS